MANNETTGVADRYASALFDLASEAGSLDETEAGSRVLRQMLDDSDDLTRFVKSPLYTADEQIRALDAVMAAANTPKLVSNFVKLVAKNRRLFALPDMLTAYAALMARHRGETVAEVTSAEPLSDSQVEALKAALGEKTGGPIDLRTNVDPSLIGGLIVRLGSQMIDTSVKTRLAGLSAAMKEAA